MPWIALVVAGLFEVVWASLLGETRGFTRPIPTLGFVAALLISMYLLSVAASAIPIGTAYAVWVGIGAVGAFAVDIAVRRTPTSIGQVLAMAALIASIVAVKATATH